jgi:hypothetical protein
VADHRERRRRIVALRHRPRDRDRLSIRTLFTLFVVRVVCQLIAADHSRSAETAVEPSPWQPQTT